MNKDCIELAIKRAHALRAATIRYAAVYMWNMIARLWYAQWWRCNKPIEGEDLLP